MSAHVVPRGQPAPSHPTLRPAAPARAATATAAAGASTLPTLAHQQPLPANHTRAKHARTKHTQTRLGHSRGSGLACRSATGGAGPPPTETALTPAEEAAQKKLAVVAAALVEKSKSVLREKIKGYEEEVREVVADSERNVAYRLLNMYTTNLLQRKIDFCKDRLGAMSQLEDDVVACSLDGQCTFALRTMYDTEAAIDRVTEEMMNTPPAQWGSIPDPVAAVEAQISARKTRVVNLPALSWSIAAEARDLEDALLAAYVQAEQIPGAKVTLQRSYSLARNLPIRPEATVDELFGGFKSMPDAAPSNASSTSASGSTGRANGAGGGQEGSSEVERMMGEVRGMMSEVENYSPDDEEKRALVQLVPLVVACAGIFNATISTWGASTVGWILQLDDPLRNLNWSHLLVPTSIAETTSLLLWTAPLTLALSALAITRDTLNDQASSSQPSSSSQSSSPPTPSSPSTSTSGNAFASAGSTGAGVATGGAADGGVSAGTAALTVVADSLQSGNRMLIYNPSNSRDDIRILYVLSTILMYTVAAPWAFGLAPAVSAKLVSWWGGSYASAVGDSPSLYKLLSLPTTALFSAALVGTWGALGSTFSDRTDSDSMRDETKYMDDLFQKSGDPGNQTWGQVSTQELSQADAEAFVRANGTSAASRTLRETMERPASKITMDFESVNKKRSTNLQEEWLRPTAITMITFYLQLEAAFTGQITAPIFTGIVAATAMDLITRPWDQCAMKVSVQINPNATR